MTKETTAEHIARDIREGRFPARSESLQEAAARGAPNIEPPCPECGRLGAQREAEELVRHIPDLVKNAMLGAWREICADTGCHPLDIEHGRGKYLTFEPAHWAQQAGEIVAAQIKSFMCDQASYADLRASGGIVDAP